MHLIEFPADISRAELDDLLHQYGAVLIRGYSLRTAEEFQNLADPLIGSWMGYKDRASKRSHVSGHIQTSTDTPAAYSIALHSESAFTSRWPQRIMFFCRRPPDDGGRTPIADTRKILNSIDREVRERVAAHGVMYVRNFSEDAGRGLGMDWQDTFQTSDKDELAVYCDANDIHHEWSDSGLRTIQVRPGIIEHPVTGQPAWFNHILALSQYALPRALHQTLLRQGGEERLPNNAFFGDGEPISAELYEHIAEAHSHHTEYFTWETGDLLILDNMLMTHGREPFAGQREILTGLADPLDWQNIGLSTHMPSALPKFTSVSAGTDRQNAGEHATEGVVSWLKQTLLDDFDMDIDDFSSSFIDVDGDSITAVEFLDKAADRFGAEFELDEFLEAPSMEDFFHQYAASLA